MLDLECSENLTPYISDFRIYIYLVVYHLRSKGAVIAMIVWSAKKSAEI